MLYTKHKHWCTYWVVAALFFFYACLQVFSPFALMKDIPFMRYFLAAWFLGVSIFDVYWFFKDKKDLKARIALWNEENKADKS